MACADVEMDIQSDEDRPRPGRREPPAIPSLVQCYQAQEMVPDKNRPLQKLMEKEPAVLGTLQILSGLFSIGVGILYAATQEIHQSFFTLFRVSQLTGVLFMSAGVVCNLLFKFPGLVTASFAINCGSFVVGLVAAVLIVVDLVDSHVQNKEIFRVEVMELCVLVLEMFFSAILCFWFYEEKRRKSK